MPSERVHTSNIIHAGSENILEADNCTRVAGVRDRPPPSKQKEESEPGSIGRLSTSRKWHNKPHPYSVGYLIIFQRAPELSK
jgi:hypothetical protein